LNDVKLGADPLTQVEYLYRHAGDTVLSDGPEKSTRIRAVDDYAQVVKPAAELLRSSRAATRARRRSSPGSALEDGTNKPDDEQLAERFVAMELTYSGGLGPHRGATPTVMSHADLSASRWFDLDAQWTILDSRRDRKTPSAPFMAGAHAQGELQTLRQTGMRPPLDSSAWKVR